MPNIYWVGLAGRAGAGKDTTARILADYLLAYHVDAVLIYRFAGPLKTMLASIGYPTPEDPRDYYVQNDLGTTYRHMAQSLGTEWGCKLIHPDVWVALAIKQVRLFSESQQVPYGAELLLSPGHTPQSYKSLAVILPDVRRPNEALAVRHTAGIDLLQTRPQGFVFEIRGREGSIAWNPLQKFILSRRLNWLNKLCKPILPHPSEWPLPYSCIDGVIDNSEFDDQFEHLRKQVEGCADYMGDTWAAAAKARLARYAV